MIANYRYWRAFWNGIKRIEWQQSTDVQQLSLSLSYETAIYFQIYYALHSACCVLLLLLPFSLSLPYALRFVCKSSPNSKLPRALFFFFLSFLCGGCRLNSSSSSSCYGLLLLLFPSLKYATLSCKFSFSTSIQKPQQLINVSLFLFPPPQLGADNIL